MKGVMTSDFSALDATANLRAFTDGNSNAYIIATGAEL